MFVKKVEFYQKIRAFFDELWLILSKFYESSESPNVIFRKVSFEKITTEKYIKVRTQNDQK